MNEKTNISKQLNKAASDKSRPIISRFRDVLDDVEKAISSGVTHEEILIILNENGLAMSLKSFRNVLYKARKKAANKPVISNQKTIKKPAKKTALIERDSSKEAEGIDLKALSKLGSKTKRNM